MLRWPNGRTVTVTRWSQGLFRPLMEIDRIILMIRGVEWALETPVHRQISATRKLGQSLFSQKLQHGKPVSKLQSELVSHVPGRSEALTIFRPWGFQPGHQAEWAKNLLNLHRHGGGDGDSGWMVPRAKALFDGTWALSWDAEVSNDVAHQDPVS